jgi:hypothetical protein
MTALGALLLLLLGAQPAPEETPPAPPGTPAPAPTAAPSDLDQRLRAIEEENARLREEVEALREDLKATGQRVDQVAPLAGRLSGYIDVGFFYVGGNGSGILADTDHRLFTDPEFAKVPDSWVFLGDPLSTAVNSRGDPADTGESRAVTFNPIGSGGKASFLVNALNLALFAAPSPSLTFNAAFDLVPRGRDVSDPNGLFLGDFLDLKLAYMEYLPPVERVRLSLHAGKFDSVLGFEYRSQEAPDRIAVTPSIICRYTCGRPIGVKARAGLLDNALIFNFSVTNGSHFIEGFSFHNEIDKNLFKTLAGRLSYHLPIASGLEVGASGAYGAQDLQPDDAIRHWHYGFDLHAETRRLDFTGEYVRGRAEGKTSPLADAPCDVAPCLRYQGAYGLVGLRLANWLMPYARLDWRDALHQSGVSFVYISQLVRATLGLRIEIGTHVVIKGEYTHNREIGKIPQFPNDVATTSLILRY